jgi:hypothetical protein
VGVPFYQYQRNEAGFFTELYLAKRAEFQGTLYKVLTEGFDLDKLKAHFRGPSQAEGKEWPWTKRRG